jgi:hypothetical protein
MRILKWLGGIVVVLAIVFVGGAFLLPKEVEVARSVEIDASAETVFPHVNGMKATQAWSPWLSLDPDVALTFTGPDEGVGSKMVWASEQDNVGNGTQVITVSDPGKRVETDLDFGPMGTAKAAFILEGEGDATTLTWTLVTDTGNNPMMRWMGLMLDGFVGADYERGLANLKTLVEGS